MDFEITVSFPNQTDHDEFVELLAKRFKSDNTAQDVAVAIVEHLFDQKQAQQLDDATQAKLTELESQVWYSKAIKHKQD